MEILCFLLSIVDNDVLDLSKSLFCLVYILRASGRFWYLCYSALDIASDTCLLLF